MRCEHIQDLLSMYIDDETTVEETLEIREHLNDCIECQKEYEELKTVLSLFSTLEPIEPPDDLKDSIMAKVKSEKSNKSIFAFKNGRWIAWGATAAVIFIIVGTVGISGLVNNQMYEKSTSQLDGVGAETEEVGIMGLEEPNLAITKEADMSDATTGSGEAPPLLAQRKIDDEVKDTRIFNTNGSRALEVVPDEYAEGQVQEELFREFFSINVEDLDISIENITKMLGSSSVVNKYKHEQEAKIIAWREKSEIDIREKIEEFGSIEFENSYVTDSLEEAYRLQLEKEMLVDTLNDRSHGYEQNLNIQKELEIIEWQIDMISLLEIEKVVFYEIRIIEKE